MGEKECSLRNAIGFGAVPTFVAHARPLARYLPENVPRPNAASSSGLAPRQVYGLTGPASASDPEGPPPDRLAIRGELRPLIQTESEREGNRFPLGSFRIIRECTLNLSLGSYALSSIQPRDTYRGGRKLRPNLTLMRQ